MADGNILDLKAAYQQAVKEWRAAESKSAGKERAAKREEALFNARRQTITEEMIKTLESELGITFTETGYIENEEENAVMAKKTTLLQLLQELQAADKNSENLHDIVEEIVAKGNYRDGMIDSDEAIKTTIERLSKEKKGTVKKPATLHEGMVDTGSKAVVIPSADECWAWWETNVEGTPLHKVLQEITKDLLFGMEDIQAMIGEGDGQYVSLGALLKAVIAKAAEEKADGEAVEPDPEAKAEGEVAKAAALQNDEEVDLWIDTVDLDAARIVLGVSDFGEKEILAKIGNKEGQYPSLDNLTIAVQRKADQLKEEMKTALAKASEDLEKSQEQLRAAEADAKVSKEQLKKYAKAYQSTPWWIFGSLVAGAVIGVYLLAPFFNT